ncbi:hypothetical protein ACFP81_12960 [Deinococcus lacus]|uniref:Uncharacterized protein n=1 Tax=Deinococcus lacus TaxID=392561 RepID=A0ABW1YER1_9DEIO
MPPSHLRQAALRDYGQELSYQDAGFVSPAAYSEALHYAGQVSDAARVPARRGRPKKAAQEKLPAAETSTAEASTEPPGPGVRWEDLGQ